MAQKMTNSGYKLLQTRRVILAGIEGYENMLRKNKEESRKLHRTSSESSATRSRKKLTEKSEWFRKAGTQSDTVSMNGPD